jgi:hypothetical protein
MEISDVECREAGGPLLLGRLGGERAPGIALAAGVHGDEPAGPWAVISVLANGLLDARFAYRVWPCTNPAGYAAGTRANADGRDVNRSFGDGSTPESCAILAANRERHFALSIDVHEDVEADGFYCYVAGPHAEPLGRAIVLAVEEAGLPVQDFDGFDFGEPAGANPNRRCEHGVVVMDADESRYFDGLSLNLFMAQQAAEHVVTLESPGRRAWGARIAVHRVAIVAAIDYLATALSRLTNGTV